MAYLLPTSSHIVLLTVRLFIPCVTLCCLYHTALLYLGQVAVVNENVLNTWLNKGEIKK